MIRKLKLPIPVAVITGSLGVGKTTALCKLVANKPAQEHWCIIVNEFGAVGIDAVALESSAAASGGRSTVTVRQIAGGCMCCAQSGVLLPAIAQIIRQTKPDRLLIEPSGLGHPAGLLDILQGPHLGSSLLLNAVICLVDLSAFNPQQLAQNPTAWDQITIADVLVGSKADTCTPATAEAFQQWASEDLFPPKAQVLLCSNGNLDNTCLSTARSTAAASGLLLRAQQHSSRAQQQRSAKQGQQQAPTNAQLAATQAAAPAELDALQQPAFEAANALTTSSQGPTTNAHWSKPAPAQTLSNPQPQPGKPLRVSGRPLPTTATYSGSSNTGGMAEVASQQQPQQQQHSSCGWVFANSDVFQQERLLQLLRDLNHAVARVKGVFRVGAKQWVMPAASELPAAQLAAAGGVQGGNAAAGEGISGSSSRFQLQEVCYRGASMVEVILGSSHPTVQHAAAAAAAATGRVCLQDSGAATGVLGDSQQQPSGANSCPVAATSPVDVWLLLEEAFVACLHAPRGG